MSNHIQIKRLDHAKNLDLPAYATAHSAGMDLAAAIDEAVILKKGEITLVPTGIILCLKEGTEAQVRPRSGLAAKYGVTVLNSPGTIDADYRGEIKVILINLGVGDFVIERGMRIAQMVIAKHEKVIWQEVDKVSETIRDAKGFGSTGHH